MSKPESGTLLYLKTFFKDRNVASLTPSSRYLIRKVCSKVDFSRPLVIVEFGPGNGVITKPLLKRLPRGSKLLVIELNDSFAEVLRRINDDRLIVEKASAEALPELLQKHGIETVDYIISGIPFSFLKPEAKTSILKNSAGILGADGKFIAYQTSRHLKKWLEQAFKDVHISYEWRNLPPMCVYEARNTKSA